MSYYSLINQFAKFATGGKPSSFYLNKGRLVEKAQNNTNLTDFGEYNFDEALQVLLNSLNQEARLNALGIYLWEQYLSELLVTRLKVFDYLKKNPNISKHNVHQPIMILGLPRTGSTFLHDLLSLDKKHNHTFTLNELYNPCPSPLPNQSQFEKRRLKSKIAVFFFQSLAPQLKVIHEINSDLPEECFILLERSLVSQSFNIRADIPSYMEWLKTQDFYDVYQHHARQLRILSYNFMDKRIILKSPIHLLNLKSLMEVYSGIKLIFTHRDPLKTIPSVSSLYQTIGSIYSDEISPFNTAQSCLEQSLQGIKQLLEHRRSGDNLNYFDVMFLDLIKNPIEIVEQIYRHFNWDLDEEFRFALEKAINHYQKKDKKSHIYSLQSFGLNSSEIAKEFQDYYDYFNITQELRSIESA